MRHIVDVGQGTCDQDIPLSREGQTVWAGIVSGTWRGGLTLGVFL